MMLNWLKKLKIWFGPMKRPSRNDDAVEAIRLEIEKSTPEHLLGFVVKELHVSEKETYVQDGMVGLSDISQLIVKDRPEMLFGPYSPRYPERIREHGGNIFAAIAQKELVVHHPYESFNVVLHFLASSRC